MRIFYIILYNILWPIWVLTVNNVRISVVRSAVHARQVTRKQTRRKRSENNTLRTIVRGRPEPRDDILASNYIVASRPKSRRKLIFGQN